ncbi:MAG TPA: M14 family metallopeptidase [Gemmatimonadota bacterium]|nr:M14 family metallopeptidase [Gemmatimonadota bacterium]
MTGLEALKRAALAASIALALPPTVTGQPGPLTRAERTGFAETSRHADVVAFLDSLAARAPGLRVFPFGWSQEGRALPLVVWAPWAGPDGFASAYAARGASGDRVRVLVFANIHAGEVAGKEAALILLRELSEGAHAAWADSILLMVAPIYNADGNERVLLTNRPLQHGPIGGMGQRANAMGLDLNRDFMKLEAPETRALVRLYREADPHVVVDLHTTNGTIHGYQLTYSPPLHPDTDPAVAGFVRDSLLPAVTAALRADPGWETWHYGNLAEDEGMDAPRGWYSFSPEPRYSTNYVGIRNRLGILSEVYSYLPFEERVWVTRRFVEAILDFAASHAGEIRRRVETADGGAVAGSELALAADFERTMGAADVLLGAVERERHPYTGEPMLRQVGPALVEPMPAFVSFRPTRTAAAPAAWLVPAGLEDVIELLAAHGVATRSLAAPIRRGVEEFRITASRQEEREYEGHRARALEGTWESVERELPAGTVVVPMDQPLARLAFHLLEPRASDGLVRWNAIEVEGAGVYPILRSTAPIP